MSEANVIPENVQNSDTAVHHEARISAAETQSRQSNNNSQKSDMSLAEIRRRSELVKSMDMDTLLSTIEAHEPHLNMQEIHKSIYAQAYNNPSAITSKQTEQLETLLIDSKHVNLEPPAAKVEETTAA